MRGVALTDAIQSGVMLSMYIILPFVLIYYWGWFGSFLDYDCPNSAMHVDHEVFVFRETSALCKSSANGCNENGCVDFCDDVYNCSGVVTATPPEDCDTAAKLDIVCTADAVGYTGFLCPGCTATYEKFVNKITGGNLVRYPNVALKPHSVVAYHGGQLYAGISCATLLNHFYSRLIAAKSDKAVQQMISPMLLSGLPIKLVGLFMGSLWMANHGPQVGETHGEPSGAPLRATTRSVHDTSSSVTYQSLLCGRR